jgi:DNA polymerase-1
MPSMQLETLSLESYSFGPHTLGAKVTINPKLENLPLPDLITFDVETDGSKEQNFVGIGICPNLKEVWYFTELNSQVIRLLSGCKLIGHGVKADLAFLKNAGFEVPLQNIFADTELMSYCMDSSKHKHGLKTLAGEIFSHKWPTYQEMTENHKVHLGLQPVEKVANYCCMDALETLRLFYHFTKHMTATQKKLHYLLELPVTKILYLRELKGVMIDVEYLKGLRAEMMPRQDQLEAQLIDKAFEIGFKHKLKKKVVERKDFNPNSPEQAVTLFNMLGMDVDSAKAEVREAYMDNPTVAKFDEYKRLKKLTSTYIDGMLELPTLPLIHSEFTQTVTITSRLSSREPNLQNIPSRGEYGPMFRKMFIARPGHIFLDGDYSAMDLRTAAHFSQEPVYLDAFLNGRDPHKETASKIFKVALDKVTKDQRNAAKTINFGVLYGEKERKLAKQLKMSEEQAIKLLDDYWQGMATLKKWIDQTKWTLKKKGGVSTLMGRFIKYPAIYAPNKYARWEAERQCVNAIIQGSNAEILKIADIKLYEAGVLALLPIHDELLVEVADNEEAIQHTARVMQNAMQNAVTLTVPMTVEVSKGKSWKEAKDESNHVFIVKVEDA